MHEPRTETRRDPAQTHQGTWSGVAVLWGLYKKRESARMGANGADGVDGPDGADGAIGTNAIEGGESRHAKTEQTRPQWPS